MNEKHGELISALLDGELSGEGQRRTVSAMLDAEDDMARFGRYRMIGDVMRGESAVMASAVAERVHEALRDEPVVLAPPRRRTVWLRPVAGLAVAASVATMAIVVAPQMLSQGGGSEAPAAAVRVVQTQPQPAIAPTLVSVPASQPSATPAPAETPVAQGAPRWQALDEQLEARLNRLVIEHQEFGGRTGINGPVPHIGLVGYDAR